MPLGAARFGLLGGVADLGKLELIETQTFSTVSTVTFTSIQESTYNVHFLSLVLTGSHQDHRLDISFSNDGGSTYENSKVRLYERSSWARNTIQLGRKY